MRPFTISVFSTLLLVADASAQSVITITLYDLAGLRPEVREEMKRETAKILREAGAQIRWAECEVAGEPVEGAECRLPLGPARLMLQLMPGKNKSNQKASGMATIQNEASVFACLYPERVKELAGEANWEFGDLLGHATAHEIGHLLLESSAHSAAGVMRARWETEDLRRLSHHGLTFLPGQLARTRATSSPASLPARPSVY